MMRTANPAFNSKTFDQFGVDFSRESSNVMTLQGTVNKTGFLLLILIWLYLEILRLMAKLRNR